MDMGNSGLQIITAITISGCSLLFLAFLRNLRTDSAQTTHTEDSPTKSATASSGKKKVRFSEDVEEPSGDNVEYRKRHGKKRVGKMERREKGVVGLPANRTALYNGINRYRSQMSTLMTYG